MGYGAGWSWGCEEGCLHLLFIHKTFKRLETSKDFEPEYQRSAQDPNVWGKALKMLVGTCFCQWWERDILLGSMDTNLRAEGRADCKRAMLSNIYTVQGKYNSLFSCWDAQGAFWEVHRQVGKQDQPCTCRRWVSPRSSKEGPHSPSLGVQSWWCREVMALPTPQSPTCLGCQALGETQQPQPVRWKLHQMMWNEQNVPPATKVRWQISPRQAGWWGRNSVSSSMCGYK